MQLLREGAGPATAARRGEQAGPCGAPRAPLVPPQADRRAAGPGPPPRPSSPAGAAPPSKRPRLGESGAGGGPGGGPGEAGRGAARGRGGGAAGRADQKEALKRPGQRGRPLPAPQLQPEGVETCGPYPTLPCAGSRARSRQEPLSPLCLCSHAGRLRLRARQRRLRHDGACLPGHACSAPVPRPALGPPGLSCVASAATP